MPTREDLEAQLERDPHDAAAFLVYADLLLEHGDPHGELIRLQHRLAQGHGEHLEREARASVALAPELAGRAKWKLGFPRRITLHWVDDSALDALIARLRSPLCRFVESMELSDLMRPRLADALADLPRLVDVKFTSRVELVRGTRPLSTNILAVAQRIAGRLETLSIESTGVAELLSELPVFPKLKLLTLVGPHLEQGDVAAAAIARSRVPPDCKLRLEQPGCTLAVEEALRAVFPLELEDCSGPGLLVELPSHHRGRYLLAPAGNDSLRIGHHVACELTLPNSGLLTVQSVFEQRGGRYTLREAGDLHTKPRELVDGQLVFLGDAALRFVLDVATARAALRRR